jgi:NADPH-dependent glutamate synthase beta subunit-like oxidoreductase
MKLTVDNKEVEVPAGATVLDAARKLGIQIPTLCHRDGHKPLTTCFVCVVRINGAMRLMPSCATPAVEGMVVESEAPEVRAARRTAIELLLSDHLGDCIGPCQSVCPAHMDIPEMIREIAEGRLRDAIVTIKQRIALPAILGRICPEICEGGCRRSAWDGPVSVCRLKRYAADVDLRSEDPYLPPCLPATGRRIAIVGTGPAGLAAAYELQQQGHDAILFDDRDEPGGMLRYGVPADQLPRPVLDAEIEQVRRMGATFRMQTALGKDVSLDELRQEFDAVLLASGDAKMAAVSIDGPARAPQGMRIDKSTQQTSVPGVFAAGAAVVPTKHAVRSLASGRAAAVAIGRFLAGVVGEVRGHIPGPGEREFTVRVGKLSHDQIIPYLQGALDATRTDTADLGFDDAQARNEAQRCLHCDCRKQDGCKLRSYAAEYEAVATHYNGGRPHFEQDASHPHIIFEPAKCINCGICVQITQEAHEPIGLSFSGRGFTVQVTAPLHMERADALTSAARECVEACPTGALVWKQCPG